MRRKIAADRAQGIYSDQDQAATLCMQRAWRARKARNQMRRMLAGMWRKGFDTASGQYYYENTALRGSRVRAAATGSSSPGPTLIPPGASPHSGDLSNDLRPGARRWLERRSEKSP